MRLYKNQWSCFVGTTELTTTKMPALSRKCNFREIKNQFSVRLKSKICVLKLLSNKKRTKLLRIIAVKLCLIFPNDKEVGQEKMYAKVNRNNLKNLYYLKNPCLLCKQYKNLSLLQKNPKISSYSNTSNKNNLKILT